MNIRDNKGSLLIISYLVIILLASFGAAFVVLSFTEGRVAERQRRSTQAGQIAEAGIERMLYDLRRDFVGDTTSPSWTDGQINTTTIALNTGSYTDFYGTVSLNGGTYAVGLKSVAGQTDQVWARAVGAYGGISQAIEVYARVYNVSPWNNAIFGGAGASGTMVNGNVDIRGSVHILGDGLVVGDYAIELGGTAQLIGNNYSGLDATLKAKIPALDTVLFGGEMVETLEAELRIKKGIVGLSGSATAGEPNVAGNSIKETIDGAYVSDGYGGTVGAGAVYSDNGATVGYDLGDVVTFPRLDEAYGTYSTYQEYLKDNALVISNATDLAKFAAITPASSFSYSSAKGSFSIDGSGNMTISGIVYLDGGALATGKSGSDKTITYAGSGVILATENVNINTNLITPGNSSFPDNILGIMTPKVMDFNEANIDVMGVFYAQDTIRVQKQTDVIGTIVSNYFDMGTNVPSIYQVPDVFNSLPAGMIGQGDVWLMRVVSWQKS